MVINRQSGATGIMRQYNDEIQLKDILIKFSDYIAYLLKMKFVIIGCFLVFSILGVLVAFNSDVEYTATQTFVVEDAQQRAGIGSMVGIASQFGFDLAGSSSNTFSQNNVLALLKSRGVVEAALMQKDTIAGKIDLFIEHYLSINNLREGWSKEEGFLPISYANRITYVHDSISGNVWMDIVENKLVVETQDQTNISSLSYSSVSQEFAKEFVDALIREMEKMHIAHKTAKARNTLDLLQNRADSVFFELELAEEEFARVKDVNQRIIKASGRLKELQLMRKVEVLNTMYLEIIKNVELAKMTLLNQTPIIAITGKPKLPLKEKKASKMLFGIGGGFLGFFLSVCFFVFRKLFKDALDVN